VLGIARNGPGPLAMTWNGKALTLAAAPPAPTDSKGLAMTALSCVTKTDCVAAGWAERSGEPVVDTWNGKVWSLHTPARPAGFISLTPGSISCVRSTYCVVAGSSAGTSAGTGVFMGTWNGTKLTPMKVPAPAGSLSTSILDVSCFSATSCGADGFWVDGTSKMPAGLTERWNGKTWTLTKITRPKGTTEADLLGISCASATGCIAVGSAETANNTFTATAVSGNGSHWSLQRVPGPGAGREDDFHSISCPTTNHCVSIGVVGSANTNSPNSLISGILNGTSWKLAAA
jgi:hypothetical protein